MSDEKDNTNPSKLQELKLYGEIFGLIFTPIISIFAMYLAYQSWYLPIADKYNRDAAINAANVNEIRASFIADLRIGMALSCRIQYDDLRQLTFRANSTNQETFANVLRPYNMPNLYRLTQDEQELLWLTFEAEKTAKQSLIVYVENANGPEADYYLERSKTYQKIYKSLMRDTLSIMSTNHKFHEVAREAFSEGLIGNIPFTKLDAKLPDDYCPEEDIRKQPSS